MSHDDKFDRLPVDAIETEMESILAEDHGFTGIRVFINRKRGDVSCSHDVPTELQGRVFAVAVKRAIIRRVREEEERRGE